MNEPFIRKEGQRLIRSTAFLVLALIALALQSLMLFVALFEPALGYKIGDPPKEAIGSPEMVRLLETVSDTKVHPGNKLEVLTNGDVFYAAILKAIGEAKESINIEAYIFARGEVTQRVVEALAERARAGVKVNVLIDSLGATLTRYGYFEPLTKAGGRMARYHPIQWHRIPRMNNRTHRELTIIDGRVGFIGGAGFADWWYKAVKQPQWRDTMVRVEGPVVSSMQAAFLENWLESTGEVLLGDIYFKFDGAMPGPSSAFVVKSAPMAGASTQARVLYQTLLSAAKRSIFITTPYFLPDRGVRAELIRAARERGVDVRVVTPGDYNDHLFTRRASRRLYGSLLEAGVKIYEYRPAMIHAKILIVDGTWSVVGSTNFDNRSFGLNDEVNMAVFDPSFAYRLTEDFQRDQSNSHQVTLDEWQRRGGKEMLEEQISRIFERQQ